MQGAVRTALGYTSFDVREIREADDADARKKILPSGESDMYALQCVYYAAVGVCWAMPLDCPSLGACRHDPVLFGECFYDALARDHYGPKFSEELEDEGRRLLGQMMADAGANLTDRMAAERDFTKAPEATSTSESAG